MRKGAKEKRRRPPDDDGDPAHMTPDEIRWTLVRQIARTLDRWRQCPSRVCRRARRCASPALECTALPSRPVTPRNDAAMRAHLYKMVRRRVAELAPPQAAPLASGPAPLHGAGDAHSRRQRSRPADNQRGGACL